MEKYKIENVKKISEKCICSACGACVSVCPSNAIRMIRNNGGYLVSSVDERKCVNCGLCLAVCNSFEKNSSNLIYDNWTEGRFISGYYGHSTDEEIRFNGQSGGVVTGILKFLLESKEIQSAIVSDFDIESQTPKAIEVHDCEGILHSAGSYYSQTAMLENVNNEIEKKGIVVLGCQAESLKLMIDKKIIKQPRIVIGLICEGQYSIEMMNDIVGGIRVKRFYSRKKKNGGWPGGVLYTEASGKEVMRPMRERTKLKKFYRCYRCSQCFDTNNIYADIVCGDPWFLCKNDINEWKDGETVIVTRTERGQKVIDEAVRKGILALTEIAPKDFFYYNMYVEGKYNNILLSNEVAKKSKYPYIHDNITFSHKHQYDLIDKIKTKIRLKYMLLSYNPRNKKEYKKIIKIRKWFDLNKH